MDEFDGFVRAVAPSLAKFAYLLCGDRHTAEDLVQSSLLKAHRSWNRVQAASNREAYVRQITLREFLSWRRRHLLGTHTRPDTTRLAGNHLRVTESIAHRRGASN